MAPTYGKGLMIQLTAWFIIVNALAYAVHPLSYSIENSNFSSWAQMVPFVAIVANVYMIKLGSNLKTLSETTTGDND